MMAAFLGGKVGSVLLLWAKTLCQWCCESWYNRNGRDWYLLFLMCHPLFGWLDLAHISPSGLESLWIYQKPGPHQADFPSLVIMCASKLIVAFILCFMWMCIVPHKTFFPWLWFIVCVLYHYAKISVLPALDCYWLFLPQNSFCTNLANCVHVCPMQAARDWWGSQTSPS